MAKRKTTLKDMDPANLNPCAVAGNLHEAIKAAAMVFSALGIAQRFIVDGIEDRQLTGDQIKGVLETVWDALEEARAHGWH